MGSIQISPPPDSCCQSTLWRHQYNGLHLTCYNNCTSKPSRKPISVNEACAIIYFRFSLHRRFWRSGWTCAFVVFSSDFGERKGKMVLLNCIAYIIQSLPSCGYTYDHILLQAAFWLAASSPHSLPFLLPSAFHFQSIPVPLACTLRHISH